MSRAKRPRRKTIQAIALLCLLACYLSSAVHIEPRDNFRIDIDLADPLRIISPMEVSYVGDLGEKGLRIPPKAGQGWRGKVGGEASYAFYAPDSGAYTLWAYCLWNDHCTNAVFAQFDDMPKAIVGNNPTYKQWHWVRAFRHKLKRGTHTLRLSNHSDHIALQRITLTRSPTATPDSNGLAFSDFFYDGFDGCDQGNFGTWKTIKGQWNVRDLEEKICFVGNALQGETENGDAFITIGKSDWSRYAVNGVFKMASTLPQEASVGVCVGVEGSDTYYAIVWHHDDTKRSAKLRVVQHTPQTEKQIHEADCIWPSERWHPFEIIVTAHMLTISRENQAPTEVSVNGPVRGGIGFVIGGNLSAYFDDIHVRSLREN